MPKRKKKAHELTNDEAVKRLFPKPVVKHLKDIVTADKPKKTKTE